MSGSLHTCSQCGAENPSDARFCIECGDSLASVTGPTTKLATPMCAGCGSENLPDARFCAMCGRSLLPSGAEIGRPWVPPSAPPPPQVRPAARRVPLAPSASMPRTVSPSIPVMPLQPIAPAHRPIQHHSRGEGSAAVVILLFGLGALFLMKLATWPMILLVMAAAFLVRQAERGRFEHGLRMVAFMGAGLFVATNPRMWPLLLIAFGVMKLFGMRRIW